ncbi:MAG TPA: hypothetical protein VFI95_11800 [Terriglobales bacterium]|nr:hypothetical protein [Terriglobales bacterium]
MSLLIRRSPSTNTGVIARLALLSAIMLATALPASGQHYKVAVSGSAYAGADMLGSGARGGGFDYWNAFPGWDSYLWVWCEAGLPCSVDLPTAFYRSSDPSYSEGCVKGTCTPYMDGSVQVSTVSFIMPKQYYCNTVSMSGRVSVGGYISGRYENGDGPGGSWELWNASISGSGEESVQFLCTGNGEFLAVSASVSYSGIAYVNRGVAERPAPGPHTSGVTYDGQSLFVTQLGSFGTISQLNRLTGAVLNTYLAPSAGGLDGRSSPSDIAYGDNHLYVTDLGSPGQGTVYDIDRAATTINNKFALPFRGGAIAFSQKRLFIGDADSGHVLITSRSGKPISSFDLPFSPAGMVFDPKYNWLQVISQTDTMKLWQFSTKGHLLSFCNGPWTPGLDGTGGLTKVGDNLFIAEVAKFELYPPEGGSVLSVVNPANLACYPALPALVKLAINPGVPIHPINPNSTGSVAVAVLSSATLDAATLDPASVRFGETGEEAAPLDWALQDVNSDGHADLLLHFGIQDAGMSCWSSWVSLTGRTLAGKSVRGTQWLLVQACR